MYSSMNVAKYVIYYCNHIDKPITNIKLQNLLYFIQGLYLAIYNKSCFEEDIMLCEFGIYIPIVYNEYKIFGNNLIYRVENKDLYNILDNDKKFINMIVDVLSNYSSTYLLNMSMKSLSRKFFSTINPIRINKYDMKENFINKYIMKGN